MSTPDLPTGWPLCVICSRPIPSLSHPWQMPVARRKTCGPGCRAEHNRRETLRRKHAKQAAGACVDCGQPKHRTGRYCRACADRKSARKRVQPVRLPVAPGQPGYRESTANVERLLAQARYARLREERQTGQRRYTIQGETVYVRQDGRVERQVGAWDQPRRGHYSNPGADEQGWGWS